MAERTGWATEPIGTALPVLLGDRGISMRALAQRVGVSQSFLSRALRGRDYKSVSGELAARIARALDLPEDYFPEYRAAYVRERLRDPALMDATYRSIRSSGT